jgi:tRNA threonylcarbamoyl adenosine modification protein (Sua5/YciO/YrdC/YwlC family)
MVGARGTVDGVAARVPESARALMAAFWPGPLTLLLAPQPTLAWDLPSDVPLAVRMPLHPVALALLLASGPLVVTSANRPGMPAPSDVDDALAQLGERIAVALDAGELLDDTGLPSTVVDASTPVLRIVRTGALAEAEIRRVCPDVLGEGSTSTA